MAKLSASGKDLLAQLQAAVEEHWGNTMVRPFDPIVEMAIYAADPSLSSHLKFKANAEIASYCYAKRKAVEIEAEGAPRILLVQFSNSGQERIIGEIHDGVAHVIDAGDTQTVPAIEQSPANGPDEPQDDEARRLAADCGDGDLVRH